MDFSDSKQCRVCGQHKPASSFYHQKDRPNPRTACTECEREQAKERMRKRMASDQGRLSIRASTAAWKKRNPHKNAQLAAAYRAGFITPPWSSTEQINDFYQMAKDLTDMLGIAHHVDHIVPLQSPIVCGLHSHTNLRVIPALMNISKGNRHWPDMP